MFVKAQYFVPIDIEDNQNVIIIFALLYIVLILLFTKGWENTN